MTTQQIMPWNLRVGDKVVMETVPRDQCRDGNPREHVVKTIRKGRGPFTGASVWHVDFDNPPDSVLMHSYAMFYGRSRSRSADRVTIRRR